MAKDRERGRKVRDQEKRIQVWYPGWEVRERMRQEDGRRAGGEYEEEKGERYGNGGSMMHENLLGDCGGYGDRKAPEPDPEPAIWCRKDNNYTYR